MTKIVPGATGTKNTTYCYDANGNMASGDGRTIAWSAFNLPTSIVKGTSTVAFSYGPDRARFKRLDTTSAGQTVTRYLGGKAYEEISRPDGSLEKKAYIGDPGSGSGTGFVIVTQTFPAGGGSSTAVRSFHTDNLKRNVFSSDQLRSFRVGAIAAQPSPRKGEGGPKGRVGVDCPIHG